MTMRESAEREHQTAGCPVALDGLGREGRARGLEAARPEKKGRNQKTVRPQREKQHRRDDAPASNVTRRR